MRQEIEIQVIIKNPKEAERKLRKDCDNNNFEVTLDKIKGLGDFMEVEAKKIFGKIGLQEKSVFTAKNAI